MSKVCRSYHWNFATWTTQLFETDIAPLEMPVLSIPVHSDGRFNVYLKHTFKVAFALVYLEIMHKWLGLIFKSEFLNSVTLSHSVWLMNRCLPVWTHWWVMSPTFPFLSCILSVPIVLITQIYINVWCVVNTFCVFFRAAIVSCLAILVAKSSPTNFKHSKFFCVK